MQAQNGTRGTAQKVGRQASTANSSDAQQSSGKGSGWASKVLGWLRKASEEGGLLVLRYEYTSARIGSTSVIVRTERTDHSGEDVMKIKNVDLEETEIKTVKDRIREKWHSDNGDSELCLFLASGKELQDSNVSLKALNINHGDTLILREPRITGGLEVEELGNFSEWDTSISERDSEKPFVLNTVICKGQNLSRVSCGEQFCPNLRINFRSQYTSKLP